MAERQTTIKKAVSVTGKGLHTGEKVTLTFKPAEENHGFKFKRIDLDGQPIVRAHVDNVVDTARGTTLEENGARIYTTEHVLASLVGMGIDNALIEMDKAETPIMDGSSRFFMEALVDAGKEELKAERKYINIPSNITFEDKGNKVYLSAQPDDHFNCEVEIDFETKVLGKQTARLDSLDNFNEEISKCRTFVFLHELEFLLNNNLIKGGDLRNAIVFVNKTVSQEELDRLADLFQKPKVQVMEQGILNNLELRFENEPARHKLLDVVGDLALLGKPIKGKIFAQRPGHYSNVQLAKLIKNQINKKTSMIKKPPFDLSKEPVYDVIQIQKVLPHRPPFLLIDKILEMDESTVVGLKNVTMNEHFFVGHFPEEPVMPGVLQIEAMAQTGGILALANVDEPENYTTLFLKIENVKFRQKVVPGDTLIFSLELVSPIRRGICHMKGQAFVGEQIVMEAEMMASIVKKEN